MRTEAIKLNIPLTEKLKSIPEVFGIRLNEQPHYELIRKEHAFEVRRYAKKLVAKITLADIGYDDFREAAFKRLAAYIFNANMQNTEIPMTSPVLQQRDGTSIWTMAFILPAKYDMANAPRPKDPDIRLEQIPAHQMAVVVYSGNNSLDKIQIYEHELTDWIRAQGDLKSIGNFVVAQYDAPFVIPFMKRNEIQIRVQ